MLVRVNVTEEHIANGRIGSCYACPVALAMKTVLNEQSYPTVGSYSIRLRRPITGQQLAKLPVIAPVHMFIGRFDSRLHVDPFEFAIEVPDLWLKKEISDAGASNPEAH